MSNIKVIKLSNGEDIVCSLIQGEKQLPDKSPLLRLDRPLLIKYVPSMTSMGFKDYVALIKWASYTDDKIITIPITRKVSSGCISLRIKYAAANAPEREPALKNAWYIGV